MYEKLKKQNGEKFAKAIRNYHNGILEIPDIDVILRHAGSEAEPLIPYLMSLLVANDNTPAPDDPFVLLSEAGYDAFHADTLEKQNGIAPYFKQGELLCTFNDATRFEDYHIVHAIKKNVNDIKREDFEGKEERQDAYGTSVISIQMLKKGGFISIKNRYNHAVEGCDNTFNSNPDKIIDGLSSALKKHFNVEFSASRVALPEEFVLIGNQILKYNQEYNNTYYGNQIWAQNGTIHEVDKSAGDAMFNDFVFNNKSKILKKIDSESKDSFANDFNHVYGGNRGMYVQNGNLMLNGEVLIGTEKSQIKTLNLPALTTMGNECLNYAEGLTEFHAPALTTMGNECLNEAQELTEFHAPALTTMGNGCLHYVDGLTKFHAPKLTTMDYGCLRNTSNLVEFHAPKLTTMGDECLRNASNLVEFHVPKLTTMGDECLRNAYVLKKFYAPKLTTMGDQSLERVEKLTEFYAPMLQDIPAYLKPFVSHPSRNNSPDVTQNFDLT